MASFWLTKRMVLEALKLSEGAPQSEIICFDGSSVVEKGVEYTIMNISTCGNKKRIKDTFKKVEL